jgi:hypothetical protein
MEELLPFLDQNRSGGVTVYERNAWNLLDKIVVLGKNDKDWQFHQQLLVEYFNDGGSYFKAMEHLMKDDNVTFSVLQKCYDVDHASNYLLFNTT